MKQFVTLMCSILLLLTSVSPVSAAAFSSGPSEILYHQETLLDNGITMVDEVIVTSHQTRSSTKTATRKRTFKSESDIIAVIAFTGTFRYDGSTVSVVSKSVTQTDTYSGWSYSQSSFTSSGGTITLTGKLKKLLIFTQSINMTLSCDKNGNISYT